MVEVRKPQPPFGIHKAISDGQKRRAVFCPPNATELFTTREQAVIVKTAIKKYGLFKVAAPTVRLLSCSDS